MAGAGFVARAGRLAKGNVRRGESLARFLRGRRLRAPPGSALEPWLCPPVNVAQPSATRLSTNAVASGRQATALGHPTFSRLPAPPNYRLPTSYVEAVTPFAHPKGVTTECSLGELLSKSLVSRIELNYVWRLSQFAD